MSVHELKPSKAMWEYYFKAQWERQNITPLSVASALADKLGGYHISYTANEVLKDLGLLTKSGRPNKEGREALAHYLHEKFHRGTDGIKIVPPDGDESK